MTGIVLLFIAASHLFLPTQSIQADKQVIPLVLPSVNKMHLQIDLQDGQARIDTDHSVPNIDIVVIHPENQLDVVKPTIVYNPIKEVYVTDTVFVNNDVAWRFFGKPLKADKPLVDKSLDIPQFALRTP